MHHLIQVCNRTGDRIVLHVIAECVPRIGETVSVTARDGTFISSKVLDVSHAFAPSTAKASCEHSRISILLDID